MRMIRFKRDCLDWIKQGIKTTTYRKNKKHGIYELVEGSRFHPKRLGIYILLIPIEKTTVTDVILNHYGSEGDFKSPREFREWLKKNRLELPETGWLHRIEYLGAIPSISR